MRISGMSCQHCARAVKEALAAVVGAGEIEVDLASGIARVDGVADRDALVAAVTGAGYGVEPV
nr:heavy metal-associated domain-containing protein [Thiocystis violacea]